MQCKQFKQTVKREKIIVACTSFHLGLHSQHAQQPGHTVRHRQIHTWIIDIKITNLFIITLQREKMMPQYQCHADQIIVKIIELGICVCVCVCACTSVCMCVSDPQKALEGQVAFWAA